MSNISGDIMLSDPILKEFFATVLSHEISGHLRSYLVKFVWTIGRRYQEANRPVDFVIDLLKFEIGNLLPSTSFLRSTVEPPNEGHFWHSQFVHCRVVFVFFCLFFGTLKNVL